VRADTLFNTHATDGARPKAKVFESLHNICPVQGLRPGLSVVPLGLKTSAEGRFLLRAPKGQGFQGVIFGDSARAYG